MARVCDFLGFVSLLAVLCVGALSCRPMDAPSQIERLKLQAESEAMKLKVELKRLKAEAKEKGPETW